MSSIIEHYKNRDPAKRVCARGLCMLDDKLLVIRRHKYGDEYIVLPGGGIDEGELPMEAAAREVFEETGIVVKPIRILEVLPGTDTHSEQHIVLCEYMSGEPTLDPDSEEARRSDNGQNTYFPMWIDKGIAIEELRPLQARAYL